MRIAAWNKCRLYRAGAVNELLKEMDKCEEHMCYARLDGQRKEL